MLIKKNILVADNGPTLLKVLQVTCKNSNYNLINVKTIEELYKTISNPKFDVIVLNNNFSSSHSSEIITARIKDKNKKTKIILIYAQADKINDELLSKAGLDSKIIMPFEGSTFLKACNDLFNKEKDDNNLNLIDDNQILENNISEKYDKKEIIMNDQLNDDASEWAIPIPGIIGIDNDEKTQAIPERIQTKEEEVEFDPFLSPGDDTNEFNIQEKVILGENQNIEEEEEEEEDPTNPDIQKPDFTTSSIDELVEQNSNPNNSFVPQSELNLEVNHNENNDNRNHEIMHNVENSISEVESTELKIDISDEVSAEEYWKAESNPKITMSDEKEKLIQEIKEELKPQIEDFVRKYCQETIEKVAWEIIPDLAENLIKKELQKISEAMKE